MANNWLSFESGHTYPCSFRHDSRNNVIMSEISRISLSNYLCSFHILSPWVESLPPGSAGTFSSEIVTDIRFLLPCIGETWPLYIVMLKSPESYHTTQTDVVRQLRTHPIRLGWP